MFRTDKRRQAHWKKGIDTDCARRKREDTTISIRRNKRDDKITKRRMALPGQVIQPTSSWDNENQAPSTEVATQLSQLPKIVQSLNSGQEKLETEATVAIRKLLSIERNPPIQQIIDAGVLPKLIKYLTPTYKAFGVLQFEAAWAVTNVASGSSRHTKAVVDAGALPHLIQLLSSQNPDIREQAVWAIANIAGESPSYRDMVLKSGALQPLMTLCGPGAKVTMLRNLTWTISNLLRGKPQPDFMLVQPCLPTVKVLVEHKDSEVVTDALWALSYVSDDSLEGNPKIAAVLNTGCAGTLVRHLGSSKSNVVTPALRTVGNILTGDDHQTQAMVNLGVLPKLVKLLAHSKKTIRKEACWGISNVTAGNPDQIQSVFDAGAVPQLLQTIMDAPYDIQKEAVWSIVNAIQGGSTAQRNFLITKGTAPALCKVLDKPDAKVLIVVLSGLDLLLACHAGSDSNPVADSIEECQGLEKIEELQTHENEGVYERAGTVLRKYWASEEDESPDMAFAPTQAAGAFQFQPAVPAQTQQSVFSF